jgi:hypothetical protein
MKARHVLGTLLNFQINQLINNNVEPSALLPLIPLNVPEVDHIAFLRPLTKKLIILKCTVWSYSSFTEAISTEIVSTETIFDLINSREEIRVFTPVVLVVSRYRYCNM